MILPFEEFFFFFFFFQGDQNTKQKKKLSKTTTQLSWMLRTAIQCKQAACTPILNKAGKGRHIYVRAWPHPSRSVWAENIANAWLPIQTYGETSKGRIFNSKA